MTAEQAPAVLLDIVSYLVLDEADQMLDMGFEPSIRQIVARPGALKSDQRHSERHINPYKWMNIHINACKSR